MKIILPLPDKQYATFLSVFKTVAWNIGVCVFTLAIAVLMTVYAFSFSWLLGLAVLTIIMILVVACLVGLIIIGDW